MALFCSLAVFVFIYFRHTSWYLDSKDVWIHFPPSVLTAHVLFRIHSCSHWISSRGGRAGWTSPKWIEKEGPAGDEQTLIKSTADHSGWSHSGLLLMENVISVVPGREKRKEYNRFLYLFLLFGDIYIYIYIYYNPATSFLWYTTFTSPPRWRTPNPSNPPAPM